ncbi:DUF2274 domain-containing protein [Sphingomonas sp. BIUV-7]|uniref:DUF2274 domain-containing protein n=1 Tax=Sphingomonas natans TaxID=3063330 RepID=A0ABT8YER1_9SPHN|nr:DUF2274 domain-containing protein [Sphingomonas sp. BIUV-7]MDO6416263.1 DUF2274 domain-containing protein [Sphingomonas sp. BIUV-7]
MANLKLGKLPERMPLKLTIAISPSLNQDLLQYADVYAEVYGQQESIVDLIPAILAAFIDGDRAFSKFKMTIAPRGQDV